MIDTSDLDLEDWRKVDELFGLRLIEDTPDLSKKVAGIIAEREKARSEKDFAKADALRDELAREGITIKDTPAGPIWQFI